MAHHVTSLNIPEKGEKLDQGRIAKVMNLSKFVAIGGSTLALLLLLLPSTRGVFSYSWLFSFGFYLTLALGGCFWTILHNLTNSGWGTSVRRLFENLGFVYPFILLFGIPFLFPFVQAELYEWFNAHRDAVTHGASFFDSSSLGFYGSNSVNEYFAHHADHHLYLLKVKAWYMNPVAWYIRIAFFAVGLTMVIKHLRNLSVEQDTDPVPTTKRLFKARGFSALGMPIFAITATFLAFDLLMALDFAWFSTMWGVYFFAGCALSSMAVLVLTTIWLQSQGYLKHVVTKEHLHIMGKFLFAFTIFWAYVSFSQYFLIWYANVTEETRYFLLRNTGNWNYLSLFLVFGHFAIPFLALLRSDVKKNPKFMIGLCCYILFVHALDLYHIVIPERGPSLDVMNHVENIRLTIPGAWVFDILAFVVMGAGFLFFFLRNLASVNLYPNRDPRILESANLSN